MKIISIKNNYGENSMFFNATKSYRTRVENSIKNSEDIKSTEDFKLIMDRINNRFTIPKYLNDFCNSKNLKFIYTKNNTPPKGFNVITTTNLVYIDCSNILFKNSKTGKYECREDSILLHYIWDAITSYTINKYPGMFLRKSEFIMYSTKTFMDMFVYTYEYIYKLSSNLYSYDKLKYITAIYFQMNHLGLSYEESSKNAIKFSEINPTVASSLDMKIDSEKMFEGFLSFFNNIKNIIEIRKEIDIQVFTQKWMSLYGEGTQFSLELLLPFISLITSVSDNIYIFNKNTIEKVCDYKNIAKLSLSTRNILLEVYGGN